MSSGNGDGGGFFDDLVNVESLSGKGNFFENVFADGLNGALQTVTMGLVGFEDGKISNGASTNLLKKAGKGTASGLKEVTGAKAAEQANELAREQFETAQADALKAREQAIYQQGVDQVRQSNLAGRVRNTGTQKLGDEKDFLGL